MFARLLPSIIKELLTFFRDPSTRRMMIGAPILQVVIFSFAATLEVRHVDIAIIDDDMGHWSRELVARVSAAKFVGSVRHAGNMEELQHLIQVREVMVGLRFKSDFSREITAGRAGPVQLIVDGRRANAGQITSSYINAIATELGLELSQDTLGSAERPRAMVRHWFNPNLAFVWFIVPSLAATLSMILPLMMTSLSIARERELGTFDQLLVSPVTSLEIILGKVLPAFIAGMFVGTLIILLAIFAYGIPFVGNLFMLYLSMSTFILGVTGVGLTISTICNTQQQAQLGTFFSMVPIILISGFVTPVENQPAWLQVIAEASPLKHFIIIVQGSFLKAMSPAEILHNMWPMLVIAGCTLTVATVAVRRHLQ